ncbi:MAG: glycosyltransferase family 1 protein [Acidobacteriota bacterium]|nr:glycosyltransferase family 1 protein [Acidobacteriota bacterium]
MKTNTLSSEVINELRSINLPEVDAFHKSLSSRTADRERNPDLICFSHLRWDFVYQRPQHLLSRAARDRRVFVIEEPIFDQGTMRMHVSEREDGLHIVVPYLPEGLSSEIATQAVLRKMVDRLFTDHAINNFVLWYYTPMALAFTQHLKPLATVYDCMDELSAFKGAPVSLKKREEQLFARADLVFTGGHSLYEAKRSQHRAVYAFPSSIDRKHFGKARTPLTAPVDQASIPHPRLGFFGVIDERFDIELLDSIARARPEWQFVMIGPVAKIEPELLPLHKNIHYLGGKSYKELPSYLAGWDVALLLFARNEATRFISPTKTPEYLAAGKPVVSTSIRDVVRPYSEQGLVKIADTKSEFIAAVDEILVGVSDRSEWLKSVDEFLSDMSWDETWSRMSQLIETVVSPREPLASEPIQPASMKAVAARAASASQITQR